MRYRKENPVKQGRILINHLEETELSENYDKTYLCRDGKLTDQNSYEHDTNKDFNCCLTGGGTYYNVNTELQSHFVQ